MEGFVGKSHAAESVLAVHSSGDPAIAGGEQAIIEVCSSPSFQKAPLMRELLMYLWRNRDNRLSEYAVGVDVLGRKADFDPKSDAAVRVHISRLRQRLNEYYEVEGASASVRFQIPIGSHRLVLAEPSLRQPEPPPAKSRLSRKWLWPVLAPILSLLLLAVAVDDWRLRTGPSDQPRWTAIHPFWQPILQKGKSVNIIVESPVFFEWAGGPYVSRDSGVNGPDAIGQSPMLRMLEKSFGKPTVSHNYTMASDTAAISRFVKYLQERGMGVTILDTQTITPDVMEARNSIVLIGPGSTTRSLRSLQHFFMEEGTGAVVNRHPLPGEPARWPVVQLAPLRFSHHGIIASVPGMTAGTRLLLLVSNYNLNPAFMLTTSWEVDKLEALRRAHGSPDYFEVVVQFERNGDKQLASTPVAFRTVRGS